VRRFLLCTDLDRTLIPNGTAPESPGARALFARLAARPEATIAYVTGRHRELIEQAIREYRLPVPDFVIADVGTTIYEAGADDWQVWQAWEQEIAPDWKGLGWRELHAILADIPDLALQPVDRQGRHKLSYHVPLQADRASLMAEMKVRLERAGVRANLVWSVDEAAGTGLLDVLPAGANKRHAIAFLMQSRGFDHDHAVFAGDSGNDLDVLLGPMQAVLVANADAEVRAAVAGTDVFLARGGWLGMNGNYSAGILEGLAHFLPDVGAWLESEA
jgi:sucrose-6F-phosphate phosphohydrolase